MCMLFEEDWTEDCTLAGLMVLSAIWMHKWMPDYVYDIRMNINPTPNYDEDNEPYIHIPKEHLTCLSDVPLGFDRDEIGLI